MGAFYGNKIKSGEINTKTGKAWTLENVPVYWKSGVEEWLKMN
jgi:hypothetical protein